MRSRPASLKERRNVVACLFVGAFFVGCVKASEPPECLALEYLAANYSESLPHFCLENRSVCFMSERLQADSSIQCGSTIVQSFESPLRPVRIQSAPVISVIDGVPVLRMRNIACAGRGAAQMLYASRHSLDVPLIRRSATAVATPPVRREQYANWLKTVCKGRSP